MSNATAHGNVHPGFEAVRQAFEENLAGSDVGAGVAISVDGELVVDLWGGYADGARSKAWNADTIVLVASASKALTAACLLKLIGEGMVDVDAPVTTYWPEFARNGKDRIPVRWLLTHQAGLPGITDPDFVYEDYFDWERMIGLLEDQAPLWEPGTQHGYHAVTSGYLWGEVVRRVSGKSLGHYLRDEICGPFELDFHIGLPERHLGRRAEVLAADPAQGSAPEFTALMERAANPESLAAQVFNVRGTPEGIANEPRQYTCEMPAANGCGTARALCGFYDALHQTVDRGVLTEATREQVYGVDAVIGVPSRFGLGFMLRHDLHPIGPDAGAFGHPGAGGNLGFRDPAAGVSFGYVMNQGKASIFGSPTAYRLVDALYGCL